MFSLHRVFSISWNSSRGAIQNIQIIPGRVCVFFFRAKQKKNANANNTQICKAREEKNTTNNAATQNIGQEYNVMYAMHNAYASMYFFNSSFVLAVGVYFSFFLCCSAIFHSALIEKSM